MMSMFGGSELGPMIDSIVSQLIPQTTPVPPNPSTIIEQLEAEEDAEEQKEEGDDRIRDNNPPDDVFQISMR